MTLNWKSTGKFIVVALVGGTVLGSAGAQTPTAQEANVVDIDPPQSVETYEVIDFGRSDSPRDDRTGTAQWRVVQQTGNCCENYVTITKDGRLLDFGGKYINYTDNRGKKWKSVQPLEPLVNGEGAIAVAPGGDVVGVEWDPYSGDHLIAFKYFAEDDKWLYNELPIHTPFFDREWISVVPGPFTIRGQKVPYVTFVKGAWPSKELWFYSTDGLDYTQVSSKFVDRTMNSAVVEKDLRVASDPEFDWIQPNTNGGLTAIGNGSAFAAPDYPSSGWSLLDGETFTWSGYRFGDGQEPAGRFQVDSAGRLHNLIPNGAKFDYRISPNGGKKWYSTTVSLPPQHAIEEIDFRANKAARVAAVAIHGNNGESDVDMLYKFDIGSNQPRATRFYRVGLGDVNGSSGVGAEIRFDFETVAIFPDGRVAMSFYDTTTTAFSLRGPVIGPALAIEGNTRF